MIDERLVMSVCFKMINELKDTYCSYSDEEIVRMMRNSENILGFLALFGDAIDINGKGYSCEMSNPSSCTECTKTCKIDEYNCIRRVMLSINLERCRKYQIVCSKIEGCITNKIILPGEFTKEYATRIVEAYAKSSPKKEYSYSIEEAV